MKCEHAQPRIPLALYGDLPPAELAELQKHLAECSACAREYQSLESLRQTLDAAPPRVEAYVDVQRILQESAFRQRRQAKRWRLAAASFGAVAAGLLLFVIFQVEIRVGGGQFVIRWGPPPEAPQPEIPQPKIITVMAPAKDSAELEERIRVVSELVRALATDIDSRDQHVRTEINTLAARLEILRAQSDTRFVEAKKDFNALYSAQFAGKE
jgi:hypothetical protein